MKTESEIYKTCIDAGLQAGDLVWMNTGVIYFITQITPHVIQAIAPNRSVCHFEADRDCYEGDTWPTYFARPQFLRSTKTALPYSEFIIATTEYIEYPDPLTLELTLEQRIERLEKKLEAEKC